MAVKNFFSGVESNQHFYACMDAGAEHVLTSFLYLEKKGDYDIVRRRKKKFPKLKVMVDSGAHSFISDAGRYKNWSLQDFEDYLDRYVKWIKKNKDYIFAAVEFDIDFALNFIFSQGNPNSNFGPNKVREWQKKHFMPLQQEGIEIVYVWHVERGLDGWEEMCSEFGYVGLPGEMSSNPDFNKYITVAKRYTTKVHGFAATKQADFRDWPWYCMSEKHKILTKRGWLSREEITTKDHAFVRLENGTAEWQKIQKVFEYDVNHIPMVEFKSRTFSAQVSQNHKWLSLRKRGRNRKAVPQFVETTNLGFDDRIPRNAKYIGSSTSHYSDDFVRLVAWFWTEGTIGKDRGRVTLSQSHIVNLPKVKAIRRMLILAGFKFCEWCNDKDGCTYFQLRTKESRRLTKLFPERVIYFWWLNQLTQHQLDIFVRTSLAADGSKVPRTKGKGYVLAQSDKRKTDSFELACILAGYPVSRFECVSNGCRMYSVGLSNVEEIYPKHAQQKQIVFSGKIWCVSTKGKNFLTRCDDKVYFTGNSVDSITWKTSEMYGTLIDWDERKQVLKFEQDKTKRINYKAKFQSYGLNADAIIAETPGSYREVTKYALISMTQMELFYARKYQDTVFYYELRMPHPIHLNKFLSDSEILAYWKKLRPKEIFKQHSEETDAAKIRKYLVAISCVQYKEESYLSNRPESVDFLKAYFAGQIPITDIVLFQKEIGIYIAPPNRRAIAREAADYSPTQNVPKKRVEEDYTLEDLEDSRHRAPIMLEDVELF